MTGTLSLSEKSAITKPQVGDFIQVEILLDEKIGNEGDTWVLLPENQSWIASGSLTLAATSLQPISGANTKFTLRALIHQPGSVHSGEVLLQHKPSGKEIKIPAANLSLEIQTESKEEASEPPWLLPTVPFGGWNVFLLSILGILFCVALFFGIRALLKKVAARRKLDHKQRAILALQALTKFAKSQKTLQQHEWKKFSFELAGILRKFSDENFLIDSSDMTDREFLSALRLQAKAHGQVDSLAHILSTIDEVRYGKKALDATVVPGLLLESKQFIEHTFQSREEEGGL